MATNISTTIYDNDNCINDNYTVNMYNNNNRTNDTFMVEMPPTKKTRVCRTVPYV